MKTRLLIVVSVLALVICGGLAPAAQAITTLDFALGPPQYTTAELKFDGGTGNALIGTDINVYNLFATTPSNSGLYTVVSGKLNFSTGNYIDNSYARWNFGGGGDLTLTGDVGYYVGSTWNSVSGGYTTLGSGTFTSAMVVGVLIPPINQTFLVTIAGFQDTKDNMLETYLGIPTTTNYHGNLNLSFFVAGSKYPGDPFDSTGSMVGSGNFINIVPAPATVLLLGSGLVGLGLLGWRRARKES